MATTKETNFCVPMIAVEAIGTSSACEAISTSVNSGVRDVKDLLRDPCNASYGETRYLNVLRGVLEHSISVYNEREKKAMSLIEACTPGNPPPFSLYAGMEEARETSMRLSMQHCEVLRCLLDIRIHDEDEIFPWDLEQWAPLWNPNNCCTSCGMTRDWDVDMNELTEGLGDMDFTTVIVEGSYEAAEAVAFDQETVTSEVEPTVAPTAEVVARHFLTVEPTIANICEREYLIESGLWSTDQAPGVNIRAIDCYHDIPNLLASSMRGILTYHAIMRTDFELTLRINAHPFCCGQIVIWCIPRAALSADFGTCPNDVTLLPHSFLNVGYETNASLKVKTVSPFNYLVRPLNGVHDEMEQVFVISVWNQLKVATGMPTVLSWSLWAKLDQPAISLKIPAYQAAKHAGILNSLVAPAANFVGGLNIPGVSTIAKIAGHIAGNFDAPISEVTDQLSLTRVDVPSVGRDLRFIQSDYVSPYEIEHIQLHKYIQTPARLYIDNWTTGDAVGTNLISMPTTVNQKFGSSPNDGYKVPFYEVSRLYRYWRGTWRITIEVIATRFHQGQLLISWCPYGKPANYAEARILMYASMDIGQNNRFSMDVPFVHDREWDLVNNDTKGFVNIWVQNPLIAPSNVSTDISINVYVSACDDMEFAVPREPTEGVYQSASGKMTEPKVWNPLEGASHGVSTFQKGHLDLTNLMRRPVLEYVVTPTPHVSYRTLIARLPYFPVGSFYRPVNFLMCRGSIRWTARVNKESRHTTALSAILVPEFAYSVPQFPNIVATADVSFPMRNGVALEASSIVGNIMRWDVPHYGTTRAFYGMEKGFGLGVARGPGLEIHLDPSQTGASTAPVRISFYWTAGDDFELIYPIPNKIRTILAGGLLSVDGVDGKEEEEVVEGRYEGRSSLGPQVELRSQKMSTAQRVAAASNAKAPTRECHCEVRCGSEPDLDCCIAHGCFLAVGEDDSGEGTASDDDDFVGATNRTNKLCRRVRNKMKKREHRKGVVFDSEEIHVNWVSQYADESDEILEDVSRMFCYYEYICAPPKVQVWYMARRTGHWNAAEDVKTWWSHYTWQEELDLFWGEGRPRFGLYADPDSNRWFFDRVQLPDPFSRGSLRSFGRVLAGFYQGFGLNEFITRIGDVFGSISRTLKETWTAISSTIRLAKRVNSFFENAEKACSKLKGFATTILESFLPIVTAAYTAYHGSGVMRAMGMAQLTHLLIKNLPPHNQQKDGEKKSEEVEMSQLSETQGYDEVDGSLGAMEAPGVKLDEIRNARLANLGYAGAVKAGKYEGRETVEEVEEDLSKVIGNHLRSFVKSTCEAMGFFLGHGFDKFLRRYMAKEEPSTWRYILRYVTGTFQYLIYGESLNIEWERKRLVELGKLNNVFVAMEAENAFTGSNLDKKDRTGKTNFVRLLELHEEVQKARVLPSEMIIPPSYASVLSRMETTYVACCRAQNMDVTQAEPIGVFLCGSPGVGKSFLISNALPSVLLSKVGMGSRKNKIYPIPIGEQKFWDGYDQQPYLYCDEFLQERDGADPLMVIRVISTARCPVNMASLKDKGMTFDSHFFVASSNEKNLQNVTQVHCKEAIKRRFEKFSCKVDLKPTYESNHRLDFSKFSADLKACKTAAEIEGLFDRVWVFSDIDLLPSGNQTRNEPRKRVFTEIVNELVAEHQSRTASFESVRNILEGFFQMMTTSEDEESEEGSDEESEDEKNSQVGPDDDDDPSVDTFVTADEPDEVDPFMGYPGGALKAKALNFIYEGKFNDREACEYYLTDATTLFLEVIAGQSLKVFNERLSSANYPFQSALGREIEKNPVLQVDTHWSVVFDHCAIVVRKQRRMRTFLGLLPMLAALGLAGTALYFGFKKFGEMAVIATGAYAAYSTDKTPKNFQKSTIRKVIDGTKILSVFHGSSDVQEKIRNNIMTVVVQSLADKEEGNDLYFTQCIAVNDRVLLIPEHLYQNYLAKSTAKKQALLLLRLPMSREGSCESMPITVSDENSCVLQDDGRDTDIRVVSMRTQAIPRMKDIRRFIRSEKQTDLANCQVPALLLGSQTAEPHGRIDVDCQVGGYIKYSCDVKKQFVRVIYSENISVTGDCGRPYVLGASYQRPIVGLHSVGTASYMGGMSPLSIESLAAAEQKLVLKTAMSIEQEEVQCRYEAKSSPYWEGTMDLVGKAEVNGVSLVHHAPGGTNFKLLTFRGQHLFHEDWDCDYKPAAQKPVNGVHPLITNAQKYNSRAFSTLKPSVHIKLVDYYVSRFPRIRNKGNLTFEECINGNDVTQPLCFDTGSGYWSLFGFKNGKKDFFEELPQEFDSAGQPCVIQRKFSAKAKQHVVPIWRMSFTDRLLECDRMAQERIAFKHFWISTTKDELRPAKKVEAGKTRVFEQPGLEYVLLVRKYFGRFLEFFKSHSGFKYYHGIGQDKEVVWANYATGFSHMGANGHAFDYSNWDGSVTAGAFQFFQDITDVYYKGCPDESTNARHVLLSVLRDGDHIMGDLLFQTNQGNKSGNPFTDVFNSVCNTYVMYACYYYCQTMAGKNPTIDTFDDCVRMLTYGDDIAMSVREDVLSWFKGPVIAQVAGCLGYTITDAGKSGIVPDSIPINGPEFTFLKSPFVYEGRANVVLSPLPMKDILKELSYAPKRAIGDEIDMQQRIKVTTRFVAHHGEKALETFKRQLREKGIPNAWLTLSYENFLLDIQAKQKEAVCEMV